MGSARPAVAQEGAPLFLVNENTTVSGVGFQFVSTKTFEGDRLSEQLATHGPSFLDKVRRALPLFSAPAYPFAPIELQRDVVRLRNFYQRNGYLDPQIDYTNTMLDTSANEINVVFSIEEGPPLIIQDVTFYGPDSTEYAVRQFSGAVRERWIEIRDRNPFRVGERYTDFNRTRIEDAVLRGLKNTGFAFARVGSDVQVDSMANTADLRFFVDAGPRGRFSEVQVAGNESVGREVILRELPFQVGERFSSDEVAQGQRELFGLQLFRVALAEVPQQERDSTVTVRYNVREASLHYLSAGGGYARDIGLTGEARWTHRNFFGAAREFSVGVLANTGFWSTPGANQQAVAPRLFRASASLRQPYLFSRKLSGVVSPFFEFERNPQLEESDEFLRINARQFGINATAIYEILPFRTASLQYSLIRALQFTQPDTTALDPGDGEAVRDIFSKSIFSAGATLGRTDDYVNPSRGFLARPLLELGGGLFGSGVQYVKAGGQLTGYLPLADRISLAGRLDGGHLIPFAESRTALDAQGSGEDFFRYEDRFDPINFYSGGANDVRGWRERLVGEKTARQVIYDRGTESADTSYVYEAVGGRSKMALSAELRMPFPGLGPNWGTAVFLDAGQVWGAGSRIEAAPQSFSLGNFRYGTGAGIRYRTPVGFLRLDVAYKVNPSFEDLRDAEDVFLRGQDAEASFWRRLRLHLSIGQSF